MKELHTRLKKVIGQISGIMRMIDEKKPCDKIIIQFQAAKAALDSAFSEALNTNLEACLRKKDAKNMKVILKLLSKK